MHVVKMDMSQLSGNGSHGGGGGDKPRKSAEGPVAAGPGKRGKPVKESVWGAYFKVLKEGDEDR